MKKGIKIFKKIMLGFLGLIVIIVILSVVFGEENKETPNTKEENTQNVSKQLTEEDKIKKIIKDTIKLKTNLENYPDRVKQIIINGTDSKFISITLVANNNWNNNYIKLGIFKDTAEVMNKLLQTYDNLDEVRFFWKFPLVDEYGNEELLNVVKLYFNNETIYKANWGNILTEDVIKVADNSYIHPALKK